MTTTREASARGHLVTLPWLRRLAWGLAVAGIGTQMAFPLVEPTLLMTAASVLLLSGAALLHAAATRGPTAAAVLLLVAGGGGLIAEAVGVRTGLPFGRYAYAGTLGPQLLDVPLLVPLAWVSMAWPALLVARRLCRARGRVATAVVGAWALSTWDVFLDPQMVAAGHWAWADPTPALPGVPGIPMSNFAGWLVVSVLVVGGLDRLLDRARERRPVADALPLTVYLWTYLSSVLAAAAFFGRPGVALVGGVLMGLVAVPLLASLLAPLLQRVRR